VRSAAPRAALTVEEVWGHLHAASQPLPSVRTALERLRDAPPAASQAVVCHGDLHPFNLLVDEGGAVTVLDWTGAAIAPPAYDAALTWLLLRHPPLEAPSALRPAISAGAAVLARRFLRAYQKANPAADLGSLRWYAALHSARVLLELDRWRRAGNPQALTHPWRLVARGAERALRHARSGFDPVRPSSSRLV
jgi:aminoglycoside phosphotransferase (APT) family kinase protein